MPNAIWHCGLGGGGEGFFVSRCCHAGGLIGAPTLALAEAAALTRELVHRKTCALARGHTPPRTIPGDDECINPSCRKPVAAIADDDGSQMFCVDHV